MTIFNLEFSHEKTARTCPGCVTGAAQADTIVLTDTFGLATTNWTNALSGLSQFDSSLGTLNAVTINLSGDIVQTLKAENTGAVGDNLTPVAGANLLFRKGTTTLQTLALSNTGSTFAASAFDGTSDFGGTSGAPWLPDRCRLAGRHHLHQRC